MVRPDKPVTPDIILTEVVDVHVHVYTYMYYSQVVGGWGEGEEVGWGRGGRRELQKRAWTTLRWACVAFLEGREEGEEGLTPANNTQPLK